MATAFKITVAPTPKPVAIPKDAPEWVEDYVTSVELWTRDVERALQAIAQRLRELTPA